MKKLTNNFTTPEQSKRLLELGIPADSADCAYRGKYMPLSILPFGMMYTQHEKNVHDLETKRDRREGFLQTCKPCWSVGRLIQIYELCYDEEYHRDRYYSPVEDIVNRIEYIITHTTERWDISKVEKRNRIMTLIYYPQKWEDGTVHIDFTNIVRCLCF